jgi:pyridoxamine 5'-phosphate oxidase
MMMLDNPPADPIPLIEQWLAEAEQTEPNDANAMSLATVDKQGYPSVRIILLKGLDERGLVFYTNLNSDKAQDLKHKPEAALCLHWKSLRRQIRAQGTVVRVSDTEADAYFATRSPQSRLGAWASDQSKIMPSRAEFESRLREQEQFFKDKEITRPPFWGGFRLIPRRIEFWIDMPYRLHDRTLYTRTDTGWRTEKLYP